MWNAIVDELFLTRGLVIPVRRGITPPLLLTARIGAAGIGLLERSEKYDRYNLPACFPVHRFHDGSFGSDLTAYFVAIMVRTIRADSAWGNLAISR
jgi:hypothetical protein